MSLARLLVPRPGKRKAQALASVTPPPPSEAPLQSSSLADVSSTLPTALQEALEDARQFCAKEREQHHAELDAARARAMQAMADLPVCFGEDGKQQACRARSELERQLALIDRALAAITDAPCQERRLMDEYVARYRELEAAEMDRRRKQAETARRATTRLLPTAPSADAASIAAAKERRDYAALVATEVAYRFGTKQKPVDFVQYDQCPKCMVAMQYNQTTQHLMCPRPGCGFLRRFADMTSANLPYGEELEFFKYSYNPVTHLDDTIRAAEAGEAYVVPAEHLERVMRILVSRGVKPEDVTIPMIRDITHKMQDIRTENVVQIYSRLTGRAPRRLSTFEKDQIRIMFMIQEPYYRKHAGERINLLSYPYTVYKYCELLGYWEMLEALPLLRGASNLTAHDAIQAKINREMDWQFVPTVRIPSGGHQHTHGGTQNTLCGPGK